jgi:hypothetical protein
MSIANDLANDLSTLQRSTLYDEMHKANSLSLLDRPRELRESIDRRFPGHKLDHHLGLLAPVAFHAQKHFDLNGSAPDIALVLPLFNEFSEIDDLIAFDLSGKQHVRTFLGKRRAPCIGMQELFEARHHPQGRVLVSSGPWSWLSNRCEGVLPIDWRLFHQVLHARRLGVIASDVDEGIKVEARLQEALPRVPVFVRDESVPGRDAV